MSVWASTRKPERICMDCGKVFIGDHAMFDETVGITCPRCASDNHMEYVEADHEHITIEVPPDWGEHPMEETAQKLFDRVMTLTGWREEKVKLWFELENPMLGGVSPEWMIMHDRAERLEKFIKDAEFYKVEYSS